MRFFNLKRKLFYIHIHKCGGTSITTTLDFDGIKDKMIHDRINDPIIRKHFDGTKSYYFNASVYDLMADYFNDELKEGFIFSSIRDPYARFISLFQQFRNHVHIFGKQINDIDEFINYYLYFKRQEEQQRIEEVKSNWTDPRCFVPNRQDVYLTRNVLVYHGDPFTQHLADENLNRKVDFIITLENMQRDWNYLKKVTGITEDIQHKNKIGNYSNNKEYLKFYTDKSYDFVTKFYEKDIEFYEKIIKENDKLTTGE